MNGSQGRQDANDGPVGAIPLRWGGPRHIELLRAALELCREHFGWSIGSAVFDLTGEHVPWDAYGFEDAPAVLSEMHIEGLANELVLTGGIDANGAPWPTLAGHWSLAIDLWVAGDARVVNALLDCGAPVPENGRRWLKEVLAGRVMRARGRRRAPGVTGLDGVLRADVVHFYGAQLEVLQADRAGLPRACGDMAPAELATQFTAEHFGCTERQISELVHPRAQRSK